MQNHSNKLGKASDHSMASSASLPGFHMYSHMQSATHLVQHLLLRSDTLWHWTSSSMLMPELLCCIRQTGCPTGSSTLIPIILSLKRKPWTYSVACFIATNSLPNVLVSREVCFFELQYIGALFRNTINPFLDQPVT